MEQPRHGTGSPGQAALAEPPRSLECRNPACHLWAVEVAPREHHDRCLFCGWQLAPVTAQDIALATDTPEWVVADPEEIICRGSELRMRAFATRLNVKRLGHTRPDYSEPCVCHDSTPIAMFGPDDLDAEGNCLYCGGTGTITAEIANHWKPRRACE